MKHVRNYFALAGFVMDDVDKASAVPETETPLVEGDKEGVEVEVRKVKSKENWFM